VINWKAAEHFHAVYNFQEATIRWFVALAGEHLPRHALCFSIQNPQWWIEEYPYPIGSSSFIGGVKSYSIVTGYPRKIFAMNRGLTDQVGDSDGNHFGDIVSATHTSLTHDGRLTLPATSLVGTPLGIVDGRGKHQVRLIESTSGNRINVTQPWMEKPDSTSKFLIGAIPWKWNSGWYRWDFKEENASRRVIIGFKPISTVGKFDFRYFVDYDENPVDSGITHPNLDSESDGVQFTVGSPDAECDMTRQNGYVQVRLDSWSPKNSWRNDVLAMEMRGLGSDQPTVFYHIIVEGAIDK